MDPPPCVRFSLAKAVKKGEDFTVTQVTYTKGSQPAGGGSKRALPLRPQAATPWPQPASQTNLAQAGDSLEEPPFRTYGLYAVFDGARL